MNRRIASEQTALLTAGQAATILGVSPGTVRRWAQKGQISYVALPSGLMRFRREDIEMLLQPVQADAAPAEFVDVPLPMSAGV